MTAACTKRTEIELVKYSNFFTSSGGSSVKTSTYLTSPEAYHGVTHYLRGNLTSAQPHFSTKYLVWHANRQAEVVYLV